MVSKSRLFRQHCRGISSETSSEDDFVREPATSTLAGNSARDSGVRIECMHGWTKVSPSGDAGSSRLESGRKLEACPTQRAEARRKLVGNFPGFTAQHFRTAEQR